MNFFNFISDLSNPEKTRNFNVFRNYSLQDFEKTVLECGLARGEQKLPDESTRISVVGTNGKGSVSHFLSELSVRFSGYKGTGLFTSPHLINPEERIRFNGNEISIPELDEILNGLPGQTVNMLRNCSYFELFTIFSFYYFRKKKCSLEIFEAGLGGRLDSTRTSIADYIVLTIIDLDHMEVLGQTKEQILSEKLNIATGRAKILFSMVQETKELNAQTEEFCRKNDITLKFFRRKEISEGYLEYNREFAWFVLSGITQIENIEFPSENKNKLLSSIPNPRGRMELLNSEPVLIFDIAHNAGAVRCLFDSVRLIYPGKNITAVFGCLKDKDLNQIGEILKNNSSIRRIFQITDPDFNQDFVNIDRISRISSEAISTVVKEEKENVILVFGSFRLYTRLKNILQNL